MIEQAGHYALESFKVYNFDRSKSIDLKFIIGSFKISESMMTGSVRGSAVVFDSRDILTTFPFVGQETIEVVYTDFFKVRRTEYYAVYAIDDVSYGHNTNGSFMQYTLYFTSPFKLLSENFRVQRAYRSSTTGTSLISDYVKDMFEEYYTRPVTETYGDKIKKSISVESTVGNQVLVVPRYTPEEAMNFFARRAYTNMNPIDAGPSSLTFRFFEARDGFYFATNEHMYVLTGEASRSSRPTSSTRPVIRFKRNYAGNVSASAQIDAMFEILDVNFSTRSNTLDTLNKGGYRRRTYEIDLLTMSVNKNNTFDYTTEFKQKDLAIIHNKDFINKHMTKEKEFFIVKDYASIGGNSGSGVREDAYTADIVNKKGAYFYNLGINQIEITTFGRNNVFAGSYVYVDLTKHKQANAEGGLEKDKNMSGMYLVESVDSIFDGNIFKQKLILTRGGIGNDK